jgi:hypothetical protein
VVFLASGHFRSFAFPLATSKTRKPRGGPLTEPFKKDSMRAPWVGAVSPVRPRDLIL